MGNKGRPRKMEFDHESALDLMRQGMHIREIAERWGMSPRTVCVRLSEERERQDYIASLRPLPQPREAFKVEVTLQFGHESDTVEDTTATEAIKRC